ncbi:hypothetical protein Cgig2_015965 [Carnegiea gigantea]|uniref:Clp R domain-containing protein n=1 Tax=Carnegiea gigantea TaxID=171969 RepID=A0A9Q1KMD3_9CARY|nr:hypothetical protein Cgig2_015965 [Carnegiea gigantea]
MPTAVETARQCLTEEAARALDDAVSVAKRRNHAQTTSLHAVSALLSPSFSLLRESLGRARSVAYSQRLQFRALELCVGVSLDRLPSASSRNANDDFAPPIANSFMAAIKRSQANQRRQPDMYHLHQLNNGSNNNNNNNPISISSIKVELKHFVLAILDDPTVSRVFGEAGFRSSDIKLAIIHPPLPPTRWATPRCPPIFLCNLMDFQGLRGGSDENCRRIGEIMVKNKERNPLLVGACANDALASFKDCLDKEKFGGLPSEIHGIKLVCLEKEIQGFVGRREKKVLELKFKQIGLMVETSGSAGVVVNLGDLKVLVKDKSSPSPSPSPSSSSSSTSSSDGEEVDQLVLKLNGLVLVYGKKLWLIGAATDYETYSKFVGSFPSIEDDWDLHPLPITSSRSSFGALSSKSSLMGSFVPFGGFFPMQSDFTAPFSGTNPPFARCGACNEKFERELCAVLREGSRVSVADRYSATLPSWLQRAESDKSRGGAMVSQVKDVTTASNGQISRLQKKWDDHCRLLHRSLLVSAPGVPLTLAPVPHSLGLPFVLDKQGGSSCSSGDSSMNGGVCSNSSSGVQILAQNISPPRKLAMADCSNRPSEISGCHPSLRGSPTSPPYSVRNLSLPFDQKLPSTAVTTDLGLGTVYASKYGGPKHPFLQGDQDHLQHFAGSISPDQGIINKKDASNYKTLFRKLSEVVTWQGEAISRTSEIVSCYRSRNGCQRSAHSRRNIWLSFMGPDKIGKKKVVEALADAMFASRECLIAVDLGSQDKGVKTNSLFLCQESHHFDINMSRITVVDHIAQELCKKPHSVVFLENIDEADPLVQQSLSRAIQTGKFQDSRGREISINNVIFVATSSITKDNKNLSPRKEFIKFAEEKILEANNWQVQIAIRTISEDANRDGGTRVSLLSPKCTSKPGTSTKRKAPNIAETSESIEVAQQAKKPKNSLDLNFPLEEAVEMDSREGDLLCDDSRAWLEEFLGQVDGNVEFKPFDFDALADKLLRKIRLTFEEMLKGESMSLEIDYEVMVQILAAAWCSDKKEAIENWIEHVLGSSFVGARERYRLSAQSVVRLGSHEGVPVKEWASGICLPARIDLSI